MVERVIRRFELEPKRFAADTAYRSGKTLQALLDCNIDPHVPVWDRSKRKDGTFSRSDFIYDKDADQYTCPAGKFLRSSGNVHSDDTLRYLGRTKDCRPCPLKEHCCSNTPQRKVPRDINEDARDYARALAKTKEFKVMRAGQNLKLLIED